jgi:hypothetical protein
MRCEVERDVVAQHTARRDGHKLRDGCGGICEAVGETDCLTKQLFDFDFEQSVGMFMTPAPIGLLIVVVEP